MLSDPAVASALAGSDIAYVAVLSASGPMVTSLLFTVRDDRLWMVMPSSSAKVAAIGRDPRVGVTVAGRTAAAVVQGAARLVDPRHPQTLLAAIPETLMSPRAVGSYLTDNLRHLAGMIGPAALAPRTLAAVRPDRTLVLEGRTIALASGWTTSSGAGSSPAGETAADAGTPTVDLRAVPDDLAGATDEAGPVIVGWMTATGPVALPGRWDPGRRVAVLAPGLFETTGGVSSTPACVLFDRTRGSRLENKAGIVLRGAGQASSGADGTEVQLRSRRVTWWRGARSRSVELAG